MKIIGIETSSIQGGVAVLETKRCARNKSNYHRLIAPARPGDQSGGNESIILIKQLLLKQGLVHGKLLIPALEKLLAKSHWRRDDIDLVAVDIGPGSYTGLRVGLAIAKTIAYIIKSKIVGVSSLDVLVANIPYKNNPARQDTPALPTFRRNGGRSGGYEYVCPVIDARWNQVYTAVYEKIKDEREKMKGKYKRISDYLAITPSDLIKLLKRKTDDKVLLFGDALKPYKELFSQLQDKVVFGNEAIWFPRASNVALLGEQSYKQGKRDNPIKLLPLYLRLTEAEINLKRRIKVI